MAIKQQKTFCRICEAQCGLVVKTEHDRVLDIQPNVEHVSSEGYACIKGLKMGDFVHSPDRLTQPLKKVDGKFEPITWSQALAEIGQRLKLIHAEHGGQSIAAYMGNPIGFNLWPSTVMTFFLKAFDADKLFTPGTQDCANKFAGGERLFGSANDQVFPDIEHTQCLIAVGSNPLISKMSFISLPKPMEKLAAIEQRGGKVYWLNPRFTESAKRFGEHVAIRPDTDVFFMLGFLHEVIVRGAVKQQRVADFMQGYATLIEVSKPWTPERVAEVTQVSADQLRAMVDCYLAADGAAIYSSTGVNQSRHGLLVYWLQEAINAITGNLDKRGGVLAGRGVFPKFNSPSVLRRSRIDNIPYVNSTIPAGIMADEILTPGKGKVRAMFNMSGNPLLSCGGSERLAEAFSALDLFVCIDIVRNETAEYADYILPGLHSLERADVPFYFFTMMGLMPNRSFDYTDQVILPPAQARDEGLIFRQLCRSAGRPLSGSKTFQWLSNGAELLAKIPVIGKLTGLDKIFLGGMIRSANLGSIQAMRKFPNGRKLSPNKPGDYLGQRVNTPSGKVELAPADLVARAKTLEQVYAQEIKHKSALKLIQKRERFTHNSWAHNVKAFIAGDRHTNYLYIHSDDAISRGLADGKIAKVSRAEKSIMLPVKIDDDMKLGSVAVPHGWGHQNAAGLSVAQQTQGVNVNIIIPDGPESLEPLSGMSHMNGVIVDVSAV